MGPERERQVADLVLAAFEQPETEQRAFLTAACGDDEELLAEALAYLDAEDEIGDFLEVPAFAAMSDSVPSGGFKGGKDSATAEDTTAEDDWRRQLGRDRLGNYDIIGRIGEGGMGQVYLGQDRRLGRRVAVKTLPPELAERKALLQRFGREARLLASLNHPNIVTIHSVEEDNGIYFLTMELVEGKTLKDSIPDEGLEIDDFLRIAIHITDALAAAHERGVIHRDLKPANVMITPDSRTAPGRAKILDFGIAKNFTGGDSLALSHEGMLMGTIPYMAPEQLQSRAVDVRSDIFALGTILYKMITGRHPFPGQAILQRVTAIVEDDPPPLVTWRQDLPEELGRIIGRCQEKDPDQRYQSAAELRDDLERLREKRLAEKILESRSGVLDRPGTDLWSGKERQPWVLVLAAVLVVAVMLGVVLLRGTSAPRPPESPGSVADAGAETPEPRRKPMAVLFFQNLTGDPALDWLSTGIPELLVTDLAQSPGLDVLGTGEVHRILQELGSLGGVALPADTVRRAAVEAGVDTILRGSYARLGDVLRIAYTLEEPLTGGVLRSESLEGRGDDSLFNLVDQLSAAVLSSLEALRPDFGPLTVRDATTASVWAWQAYSEGIDLYHKEGRTKDAIERLEEALRLDSEFALAFVNIAKMHQSLGHNAEAADYSQRAFELVERLPLNNRFDAEAGYYGTRWSTTGRAIETYDLALKIYPHQETWRNNLARRYAFYERYSEAIEEFEKLIHSDREFWGDYYGAANAYAALGDFEKGYGLLTDLAERLPDHWLLHYALAWHLTEWGRFDEASEGFARVAQLRSDTPSLHYGRWRLEVLREDWEAADIEARQLLTFDDSFALWRGNVSLARQALYRGQSREALTHFDAAIAASTGADRSLARCFKAELLLARNENEAALKEARLAEDEGREHWPELRAFYLAALAEEALGRSDAADERLEMLRERWRRQPNAVEERQLLHLSGRLALMRGDEEAGLADLDRAAALLPANGIEFSWHVFPDHVPIWTSLGEALLGVGRPEAALEWLSRATTSGSEHLEQPVPYVKSFYLLGLAHRRLGQEGEAEEGFARFLAYWLGGDLQEEWLAEIVASD